MVSVIYRFRAKNRDWVWLRTSAFAFLNPYNDDVEYIVCTNTHAKYESTLDRVQFTYSVSCKCIFESFSFLSLCTLTLKTFVLDI